MEPIFRISDEYRGADYEFSRLGRWPEVSGYRLGGGQDGYARLTVRASKRKLPGIHEKELFNEGHATEIVANMLLKEMRDPGPARLRYFREKTMTPNEIADFKRTRLPKGEIRKPVYAGAPLLIKWHYLMMGLDRIEGRTVDELESLAEILDAFYKIGLFCGAIRKEHNLVYHDLKADHFVIKDRRLYVLDFGWIRFAESEDEGAPSSFVADEACRRWLFDVCGGSRQKKTREFLSGYEDGFRKG